jgi:putative endonuclease
MLGWFAALTEPLWLTLDRRLPLGRRGENAAARFLARRGCKIVARGQRGQIGEIDLVAVDGRTVVFVEVKTRTTQDAGHPADAVDQAKQRQLTRLALAFLQRHDLLEAKSRFDVVAITWPAGDRPPQIEHFPDAFEAIGSEGMFS